MNIRDVPAEVHFVGIGGVGMSGLAQQLHSLGRRVTGSDRVRSQLTDALAAQGIEVHIGHSADNVGSAQLVVRTSAVPEDNVEVATAASRGVPVVLREELLGAVFNSFRRRVAVCGTHGKTTVTAMLHQILLSAGVEHAAFIGGVYRGSNWYGGADTVIAEACEFNRSFFNLQPTLCVCLNAEHDHPDCYKTVEDVKKAFAHFMRQTSPDGCVVLPSALRSLYTRKNRVFWDKLPVSNVRLLEGRPCFDVCVDGLCRHVQLNILGRHNIGNALAALAAAQQLGVSAEDAICGLQDFCGVDRRWTEVDTGICRTVLDYAHHPTEISCSIAAAASVAKGRVLCVFQPHTYSRTKAFWEDFARCFAGADAVAFLPIYSAREKPIPGVNSYLLAQTAVRCGVNACFLADFLSARQWVLGNAAPNDLLLVLGAGDVCRLADLLRCPG